MTSIEIHRRSSFHQQGAPGSLFVRVIHGRKTRSMTLPWRLYSSEWDNHSRRVILEPGKQVNKTERSGRIEWLINTARHLEEEKRVLHGIVEKLEERGSFTAFEIIEIYRKYRKGTSLSTFARKLCCLLEENGQERTARAYRSAVNRIIRFRGGEDMLIKQITPSFLSELQKEILSEGRSLNTVSFYMRNLRAIYKKAVKEGLIKENGNPFEEVYTGIRQTNKRALSHTEICKLDNLDFLKENKRFKNAQMLFLFSFLARGMSFVDMAYLKKNAIRDGRIIYRRKKTGTMINIKITPSLQKILVYFESETTGSSFVFPIIRNVHMPFRRQYESGLRLQNKHLKRIAQFGNIDKILSTHVARHTWATLAQREHIPLSVISEGLGHKSERTTSIYLAGFEQAVIDNAGCKVEEVIIKKAV